MGLVLSDMNGLSRCVVVCGKKEGSKREYAVAIGDDENDDDQGGKSFLSSGRVSPLCSLDFVHNNNRVTLQR